MSDMSELAIKVDNLSKDFLLPHAKNKSLKQAAISLIKRNNTLELQQALKNVSFEVKKGEFFGVVGRNGSGKSTLLKILAGVYVPTKGKVRINGTLVPFIELGVGFNPELSGRDNVFLNGALLGFSRREMSNMYDEIIEFAELEKFMDQKLKNYSSGMQVRLAFSIAIKAKGDILLLDEVLAVGDAAFQRKCLNYFDNLKLNKQTVVLVTHSMDTIEKYCDRAAMLHDGKLVHIGAPDDIAQEYRDINVQISSNKESRLQSNRKHSDKHGVNMSVQAIDETGKPAESINPANKLILDIKIKTEDHIDDIALGIIIFNSNNIPVFASNTASQGISLSLGKRKNTELKYIIDNIFSNDAYRVKVSLRDQDNTLVYYSNNQAAEFRSLGRKHTYALVNPAFDINITQE